ncbi:MAG TPA: hypothetical protein VMV23_05425 [Candidatus Nanopelagicaceae bacterium]|nr:hypothetical protein [Candidatus Nanopelagicaceae bacterium]
MRSIRLTTNRHEHESKHRNRKPAKVQIASAIILAAAGGTLLWAENAGKLPPKGTWPIY